MRLSFLPVPGFIAVIAVLYSVIKPSLFYEPAWILPITNTIFVTVVLFIVAYIAMRNYKATGRIQILLLGCGVLAFGIGGIVAGLVRSLPEAGANLNVTIYNTSALIGAIFHFIAAWILLAGISPEVGSKGKKFWLLFGYVGLTLFMGLFTLASLKGLIPLFFIQGVGPTVLRQWVLGSAHILFAFSFLIFMASYLRNREVFLFWYSSALALTAISLAAFFIQSAVGSPIGWVGRLSQYLGGIYFLIAIITAARSAQARKISFDTVLTTALSAGEEKFRALAENSPDMISCFDREMKHIYVNQAGLRVYQRPAGSIIGKTLEETELPVSYIRLLRERVQQTFESGQPTKVEDYIPTEGRPRFFESYCVPGFGVDGTVANVLIVSRDLSERKRLEEELRELEEKSRLLIKHAPSMIYEIDFHRPAFKSVNDVMCQFLGYTREELLAMSPFDLLDDEGKAVFRERIRRKLIGEAISDSVEYKSRTKDGREVYGVLNMTFTYKDGKPEGAIVVAHDITERKRAEEALREGEKRLVANLDAMTRLQKVGTLFVREGNLEPVLEEIVETAIAISGADFGNIQLLDPESSVLQIVAHRGFPKWWIEFWNRMSEGRGACGTALERGERVIVEDVEQSPIFVGTPALEMQLKAGVRAVQSTPLKSRSGKLLGMFSTHYKTPGWPDERVLRLLDLLARQAADIIERAQVEEELRRNRDELEDRVHQRTLELRESEQRLRQLSAELLNAQEKERRLIGREIHDSIGASLAATKFKVEHALNEIGEGKSQARVALESVIPIIQETVKEARRIQMNLRPSTLDDLGILATIGWFCRQYESTYSAIHVKQEIHIEEHEVSDSLKTVIFRVLQEALNNVAKHSEAHEVLLCLDKTDQAIQLVIRDNGHGFMEEEILSRDRSRRGVGLDSMRERTELSGGTFTIKSSDSGTIIQASWPL